MSLDASAILDIFNAVQSHALASGLFESVNGHEPKSAPAVGGLIAAVWADVIDPDKTTTGLAATSARLVLNVRLYSNMLQEPQDAIDPNLLAATVTLMAAYSGDFTLGGAVFDIDLLGHSGIPLRAQAGYINQDSKMFRVMTIALPVIVDNAWTQAS